MVLAYGFCEQALGGIGGICKIFVNLQKKVKNLDILRQLP
jgi:hypothetical protein